MKTNLILSLLFSTLFFLSACGGQVNEDAATPKAQSEGNESTCKETLIALQGDNFSLSNFKVEGLQVYRDFMQSGNLRYPALILAMTNYRKEGAYVSEPTKDNEVQLIINFSGKAGSTITAQSYDIAGEGFGKSDALIVTFKTKDRTYALNLPSGKGEITYLSADRICGTVDVKSQNGRTIVKGNFSCNLK